ncbi:dienelactone hydrolase family protein [Cohnella hashimotonis]|uniref:Dienelactone hydrolase family protein n=1 Tax=Cohnella hashimotonis TaxID=2826895 RepID=A0ABT6TA53_9BACL|nr:dienelactone hydrolase family protein [Cohnella hashimotonis]MDI4643713.1 dienelactone hydrolase family protein [Cohnella hashimotonis]
MAEILLLHHVMGLTKGIHAFADKLRAAGHTVHVPDFFDGHLFAAMEDGMAYVNKIGFEEIAERGIRAAHALPREIVYAGFSLGVVAAQKLAQTREGARGALLFHACVPPSAFGSPWPAGLPAQIHGMDADPYLVDEGDIEAARELVATADLAELFLYPGDQHLFADSSLPSFNVDATTLALQRVLEFLGHLDA